MYLYFRCFHVTPLSAITFKYFEFSYCTLSYMLFLLKTELFILQITRNIIDHAIEQCIHS